MKYNSIKVIVLLLSIAAFLSACGLPIASSSDQGQPVATIKPAVVVAEPSATQAAAGGKYFQEDFNGDLSNWSQFIVNGSKALKSNNAGNPVLADTAFGKMTIGITDGFLVFDLQSVGQWVYTTYDPETYDDVKVEVSADNRGTNDNNVSLICRYDPAEGWYEFNIANSGLYNIYYAVVRQDKTVIYTRLADGGFTKIKSGKDVNDYAITCQGRTLTLYINGYDVKAYDDNNYVLKKGKIGVSVSSFTSLPAKVQFDWIKVSQP
jgi:hypothetical protein